MIATWVECSIAPDVAVTVTVKFSGAACYLLHMPPRVSRSSARFSAATLGEHEELTDQIQAAVGRIEWALREVLPGQTDEISSLSFYPTLDVPPLQDPKTVL